MGLFDVQAFGTHRLPERGGCLVAATHQSFLDPVFVGLALRRQLCYLARDSLFRAPLLGPLIRALGAHPVARGRASSRDALRRSAEILDDGRALIIFPEGTRSSDGRIQPLKRGAAMVARRSQVPILPVLVVGTHGVWPRGRRLPRLRLQWHRWPRRVRAKGDGAGRGREALSGKSAGRCVRIFVGEPMELLPDERPDAFTERLSRTYARLAEEAGVFELVSAEELADENEGTSSEPGRLMKHRRETP